MFVTNFSKINDKKKENKGSSLLFVISIRISKTNSNIISLKSIQIRTDYTRSQSLAEAEESAGAAMSSLTTALGGNR